MSLANELSWDAPRSRTTASSRKEDGASRSHRNFFDDIPKWKEEPFLRQRERVKIDAFDIITVLGYSSVAVGLLISAIAGLLYAQDEWVFLKFFGGLIAIFLLGGRILEIRWRRRNAI